MTIRWSGFADEAATSLSDQLALLAELGWRHIDLRKVDGVPVHELPFDQCQRLAEQCQTAGVTVACIGSAIADGRSSISDDPAIALGQTARCIERARLFACRQVRVMSWPPVKGADRSVDEPTAAERISRLREIVQRFADAGIRALHENCHNYGGQSLAHTQRLLAEIPGLGLIFDTANPIGTDDWAHPEPRPKQSPWALWCALREHVVQLHLKDGTFDPTTGTYRACLPGLGQGDIAAVLRDALARGFDGVISIEPHLKHLDPDLSRERWLAAGRQVMTLVEQIEAWNRLDQGAFE